MQRLLSESPQGRRYLAHDPRGGAVALKELAPANGAAKDQVERFMQEAELLRSLKHPAVPRLVDSFQDAEGRQRRFFLAQESVEGRSLLAWLDLGPFSTLEAGDVAWELLEFLAYLHNRSPAVIHRDIQPATVLMRPTGKIAVLDFGAARSVQAGTVRRASRSGTPGYAPPEQLAGGYDATSDLYAVGATLVHLLTGRPPIELLRDDQELDFAPHLPAPHWAPFLGMLVARQPGDRFRSAEEALGALKKIAPRG